MPSQIGSADWYKLLKKLEKLQQKWETKLGDFTTRGRGLWAHGVLLGIETGRLRIAEESANPLTELNALLENWENIGRQKNVGTAAESVKGVDFGIQLVIKKVQQYLNRPARPKPPTSANGNGATWRHGRK